MVGVFVKTMGWNGLFTIFTQIHMRNHNADKKNDSSFRSETSGRESFRKKASHNITRFGVGYHQPIRNLFR